MFVSVVVLRANEKRLIDITDQASDGELELKENP